MTYRLPGFIRFTEDVEEYIAAWEEIIMPICDLTGAELIGFDPSFQLEYGEESILLPVKFAIRLSEIIRCCFE